VDCRFENLAPGANTGNGGVNFNIHMDTDALRVGEPSG
jgi:hypothetical protein